MRIQDSISALTGRGIERVGKELLPQTLFVSQGVDKNPGKGVSKQDPNAVNITLTPDTSTSDTSTSDTSTPDTAIPDTATSDTSIPDTATSEATVNASIGNVTVTEAGDGHFYSHIRFCTIKCCDTLLRNQRWDSLQWI